MSADKRRLDPEDRVPLLPPEQKASAADGDDPDVQWHDDLNREVERLLSQPAVSRRASRSAARPAAPPQEPVNERATSDRVSRAREATEPVTAPLAPPPPLPKFSTPNLLILETDAIEPPGAPQEPAQKAAVAPRDLSPVKPVSVEVQAVNAAAELSVERSQAVAVMSAELRDRLRRQYAAEYERDSRKERVPVVARLSTALVPMVVWPSLQMKRAVAVVSRRIESARVARRERLERREAESQQAQALKTSVPPKIAAMKPQRAVKPAVLNPQPEPPKRLAAATASQVAARLVIKIPVSAAKESLDRSVRAVAVMPQRLAGAMGTVTRRAMNRSLELIGDFVMPMPESFDWRGLRRAMATLGFIVLASSALTVMLLSQPVNRRTLGFLWSAALPSTRLSFNVPLLPARSGIGKARKNMAAVAIPVHVPSDESEVGASPMALPPDPTVANATDVSPTSRAASQAPAEPPPPAVPIASDQRAAPVPVATTGTVEPADHVYSARDGDVRPPTALSRQARADQSPGVTPDQLIDLDITITEAGDVDSVKVSSGAPRMDIAMMLSAVKNWKFDPATRNGHPVKYSMHLRVPRMR
jgi:hypothetical protein